VQKEKAPMTEAMDVALMGAFVLFMILTAIWAARVTDYSITLKKKKFRPKNKDEKP
jgi:hypothetical protein